MRGLMKRLASVLLIALLLINPFYANINLKVKAESTASIKVTGYNSVKVYNGQKQTQSNLKVYYGGELLTNSKDYSLNYFNNIKVGTAKITINLKGNYQGSKSVEFSIIPMSTKVKSIKPSAKQINISWYKKSKQIDGYQIEYSRYKSFKHSSKKTVKSYKTTALTIKNLNAKNKYYVRIRTYKKVGKKIYHSKWSAIQNTTVPVKKYSKTPSIKTLLNDESLHPQKTNSPKLDALITKIFNKIHTKKMTTYDKVRACYDYLIKTTTYGSPIIFIGNASGDLVYESDYDWALVEYAYSLLSTKYGVCDNYSAAFVVMCRRIGLDAHIVGGTVSKKGGGRTGHAWTYIKLNGTQYVFDPQVQSNNMHVPYYYFGKTYSSLGKTYKIEKDSYDATTFKNFDCYKMPDYNLQLDYSLIGNTSYKDSVKQKGTSLSSDIAGCLDGGIITKDNGTVNIKVKPLGGSKSYYFGVVVYYKGNKKGKVIIDKEIKGESERNFTIDYNDYCKKENVTFELVLLDVKNTNSYLTVNSINFLKPDQ